MEVAGGIIHNSARHIDSTTLGARRRLEVFPGKWNYSKGFGASVQTWEFRVRPESSIESEPVDMSCNGEGRCAVMSHA